MTRRGDENHDGESPAAVATSRSAPPCRPRSDMSFRTFRRSAVLLTVASATLTSGVLAGTASAKPQTPSPDFTLTILHANDLESSLLPVPGVSGGPAYGGVDRFVELIQQQQKLAVTGKPAAGQAAKRGVLTISAGDNFLPGPQLAASGADPAQQIYDATAFAAAGFDVSIFGNHDFDQTPDFLARWLTDVGSGATFVAGNLGFSAEPQLLAQVQDGTIVSTHVEKI